MPKTSDSRRHWLRLPAWPARERAAWIAATGPCHPLDIPLYGQRLRPESLASLERFYGRYLNFLSQIGELDLGQAPRERVTPARVAAYVRHIRELAYRGQTPVHLISGISGAMKILAPDDDFRWIWRPRGTSIAEGLRGARNIFDVPKASDMYAWGHELMARGDALPDGVMKLVALRDGLMIALFAARPLRRRTMAGLRLGKHLLRMKDGWRLVLEPEDMKNRRALEFDVPDTLTSRFDQYVKDVRSRLIKGAATDAVWISAVGGPLAVTQVGLMIRSRAIEHFGFAFGPHRFRHAVGTSAPIEDPSHQGIAAAVLAVGGGMVAKHYDRSENHTAAGGLHAAVELERDSTASLAARLYQERRTAKPRARRRSN